MMRNGTMVYGELHTPGCAPTRKVIVINYYSEYCMRAPEREVAFMSAEEEYWYQYGDDADLEEEVPADFFRQLGREENRGDASYRKQTRRSLRARREQLYLQELNQDY